MVSYLVVSERMGAMNRAHKREGINKIDDILRVSCDTDTVVYGDRVFRRYDSGRKILGFIEDGADVGGLATLGKNSVLCRGTRIGSRVNVGSRAIVMAMSELGNSVRIMDGALVRDGVCIGDRTEIGFGARVGSNSVIGKGVSIGTYSLIGSNVYVGDGTRIGYGVQTTDNVYIGRNVEIGESSLILSYGAVIDDGEMVPERSSIYGRAGKMLRR